MSARDSATRSPLDEGCSGASSNRRERIQAGRPSTGRSPDPTPVDRSGSDADARAGGRPVLRIVPSGSGEGASVADGHPQAFDTGHLAVAPDDVRFGGLGRVRDDLGRRRVSGPTVR